MTGVTFDAVTRRYGDVVALDRLDLEVGDGELLVMVGSSGSGKSTALRLLAGLDRPTSGRVLVGDRDVTGLAPERRDVAMVFQDDALYPHLTARENLAFGMRVRRVPAARIGEAVDRVAAQLGLDGLLDRYPDQLSGGQRQRVALGRAMVREPAAYLLDEPLSNLDAQLRTSARAEIVELQRRLGTTTIHVTHDQVEALTMGDRVAVMAGGALQQVGPPQECYDRPANRFVASFLGTPPMNLVPGGGVLGGTPDVEVGVRPEDLHVDATGPIEAGVVIVEALGSESILTVETPDGTRMAVRTPPRSGAGRGDRLRLRADPARLHHFDASTGARR